MAKTLEEHYGYLSDQVKLDRYETVIEKLVRPGQVVLDLGCGAGPLGLMALRAGASKVIFVEQGEILEAARRTVAEAGFIEKAEFLQANSFELTLPENVDVVVCDHIGCFGFDYGILQLLADAKTRFLKPSGIIVPQQIELKLAPVESEECREFVGQWHNGNVPDAFGWLAVTAANTKYRVQLSAEHLLADAKTLATLQLGAETSPFLTWNAEFLCSRNATLDGLAGWFDCQLHGDVCLTNSPAIAKRLNRPLAFLPLESPVTVSEGERISATVMVRHLEDVIGWVVELPDSGQRFALSTFNGLLLGQEALRRAYPDRVATPNARGHARQIVLSYCDGRRSVAEVQALVEREHPDLFPSAQAMSAFITHVLARDTSG